MNNKNELAVKTASFYQDVRAILEKARHQTYAAINAAMLDAYWQIGERIVEEEQQGEQRASYGQALIK